jgi:hypothetical protein
MSTIKSHPYTELMFSLFSNFGTDFHLFVQTGLVLVAHTIHD